MAIAFASFSSATFHLLLLLLHLVIPSSSLRPTRNDQYHQQAHMVQYLANQTSCNLFSGSWMLDASYPLYQASGCSVIDQEVNCQALGRPDSDYQRYRWKPMNCDLPSFNAYDFLTNMRGKTLMFVGDSLSRNQWESLICMLSPAVSPSEAQFTKGDPLSTFKFLTHDFTVSFFWAPYLVDIDVVDGMKILKLEDIRRNADGWGGVDVISFNSGHWWSHEGDLQGWDYIEMGGAYTADMDRLAAFENGMRTWARWVDNNLNPSRTRVFFLGIPPTHDNLRKSNDGTSKNCYGETSPTNAYAYSGTHTDQMNVIQNVIQDMANPPSLLDITALSELRKDGHPSIYSGDLIPGQRANPGQSADCSHWCLPGVPDTWNELLHASLFVNFGQFQDDYLYGFACLISPNLKLLTSVILFFMFWIE